MENKTAFLGTEISDEGFNDMKSIQVALESTQATIQFDTNGIILFANENFCKAMGYQFNEIKGKHHSIFCDSEYIKTQDYKKFWEDLVSGKSFTNLYK